MNTLPIEKHRLRTSEFELEVCVELRETNIMLTLRPIRGKPTDEATVQRWLNDIIEPFAGDPRQIIVFDPMSGGFDITPPLAPSTKGESR